MKEIPVSPDKVALVDDDDFERISKFRWYYRKPGYADCSMRESVGVWKNYPMHKIILDIPNGAVVDHINRNGLDNRKQNLRICTCSENNMNRSSVNKYGFRGIDQRSKNSWRAEIRIDGKVIRASPFKTPEEAALAYDKMAKQYHGDFAQLNFNARAG